MKKPQKIMLRLLFIFIAIIILVIAFLSPLTKYLIEKYDKKYTGREIYIGSVYVNPFTGYININNLRLHEFESDSVFFSCKNLSLNVAMLKLFQKKYELSEVKFDIPKGKIIQRNNAFNFSDLIKKFSNKDSKKKKNKDFEFTLKNVKIVDGIFYYQELVTPIYYSIKEVNIESKNISWDVDTIPFLFSFLSGTDKGKMQGDFTINTKNKNYSLNILINKFDLNIVGQYIKDLSNYGNFKAFLDADFHSKGNFIDKENLTAKGKIKISDFHFGKNQLEDYASFEKLEINIHQVSPKKMIYFYDSVLLYKPYFKYEKYDFLDNVQTVFGKAGANVKAANTEGAKFNLVIEIAKYIKTISKNFLRSNYRVDRLAIYDAEIKFNDYTLNEQFSIELKPFNFIADSIDKKHSRVKFQLNSGILPYGYMNLTLSINPKDSSDFSLVYNFNQLPVALFNPYLAKFTSFPLDRGSLEIKGNWLVKNGEINSNNHLIIIDPRIGQRIKNKNSRWLPMRFIMFFVRERGNVIDYEVPIKGDLKNPKFVLKDVIFDALGNIFIKPPTTPYRMEVRNVETEIEKSLTFKWETRSNEILASEQSFLKSLASFLNENDDANISVAPQNYDAKEFESILLFEAKKKYYLQIANNNTGFFNNEDSIIVDQMSIKDSLFVQYLNRNVNDSLLFTVQAKCALLINKQLVNTKLNKLYASRLINFKSYLKNNSKKLNIIYLQGKNVIPFNGYSFYKIDYKGEFPEYLIKAYRKMNRFNNEAPRDKYNRKKS